MLFYKKTLSLASFVFKVYVFNTIHSLKDRFVRKNVLNSTNYILPENILSVYPNPAKGEIYIHLDNHFVFETVILYDITGTIIKKYRDIKGSIDISEISTGIYFIELMQGKEIHRTKFLKE